MLDGKDGKVTSMQFHLKFFLTKRVATITIKYPDLYDFKKVCIKIIAEFPRELADGTVSQSDFRDIMEKHIMIWSEKAYVAKEPVRFIGLQVSFKLFSKYKMYKIKFHYRSMFCLCNSQIGNLRIWNVFLTVNRVSWVLMENQS